MTDFRVGDEVYYVHSKVTAIDSDDFEIKAAVCKGKIKSINKYSDVDDDVIEVVRLSTGHSAYSRFMSTCEVEAVYNYMHSLNIELDIAKQMLKEKFDINMDEDTEDTNVKCEATDA